MKSMRNVVRVLRKYKAFMEWIEKVASKTGDVAPRI